LLSKFENIESKSIPKTDQFLAFTSLEAFQVLCFQKLKEKYLKYLKGCGFWKRQPIISAPDRKNTFTEPGWISSCIPEAKHALNHVKPILAVLLPVFQSLLT
jgi:hypothetical protein